MTVILKYIQIGLLVEEDYFHKACTWTPYVANHQTTDSTQYDSRMTWLIGIRYLYPAAQHTLTQSCGLLVCQLATSGMCFIGEQMKNT